MFAERQTSAEKRTIRLRSLWVFFLLLLKGSTFIPLQDIGNFWFPCGKSILKTLWEKKKMLLTINVSFPVSISSLRKTNEKNESHLFCLMLSNRSSLYIVFGERFQGIKLLCHGLRLILSQTKNFRRFQIERLCRRQFQIWWKWQKVLEMG